MQNSRSLELWIGWICSLIRGTSSCSENLRNLVRKLGTVIFTYLGFVTELTTHVFVVVTLNNQSWPILQNNNWHLWILVWLYMFFCLKSRKVFDFRPETHKIGKVFDHGPKTDFQKTRKVFAKLGKFFRNWESLCAESFSTSLYVIILSSLTHGDRRVDTNYWHPVHQDAKEPYKHQISQFWASASKSSGKSATPLKI